MDRLRFLHIPKTAGETLTNILRRQYRGRKIFNFTGGTASDRSRFMAMSQGERAEIALFTGHAPITTHIPEADQALMITLIRDPVSRVKSYCQYIYEGKVPALRAEYPAENFQLNKLLSSGELELSNLQTKILINDDEPTSSEMLKRMSADSARDTALENLFRRVSVFGLQEHFDESLILFRKALGWAMPTYRSYNVKDSTKRLNFTAQQIDRIRDLNAIDLEVHSAARKEFLSRIKDIPLLALHVWVLRVMRRLNPPPKPGTAIFKPSR